MARKRTERAINFYGMIEKHENAFRNFNDLFEYQINQFKYTGLPDTVPAEFLEGFYAVNGTVGVGYIGNDVYCAAGSYNGDVNGYLPKSYTAAVNGIGEINGDWYGDNATVVVGINNKLRLPELDLIHIAEILTEVDTSEICNVIFSRFLRIPYAENDTQKQSIQECIDKIIKGDVKAVATRNAITDYLTSGGSTFKNDKFLDLVDPDMIHNLQYLCQYRDNIMKRYFMRRGYMFNVTTKMAQQTNDELHGSDDLAMLYPLQQLECRQKFIEECNAMFGWNATVEFNPILKNVYDRVMNYKKDENNEQDIMKNDDSETTEGGENNENGNSETDTGNND